MMVEPLPVLMHRGEFFTSQDTLHFVSGLNHHATILSHMFHLLETGKIVAPLYDPAQCPGVSTNQVCNVLVLVHR